MSYSEDSLDDGDEVPSDENEEKTVGNGGEDDKNKGDETPFGLNENLTEGG